MDKVINKIRGVSALLWVCVIIPTVIAIIYFGLISSDVYISESRFVVRSPEKANASALGALLKTGGFNNDSNESYATHDYILSRDALSTLDNRGMVTRAYSNSDISIFNRFNPFGWSGSREELYKYYKDKVKAEQDAVSSITTLQIRAFRPTDAQRINRSLLDQAETLVNRLNIRGRQDLIDYAYKEVEESKVKASNAALALSDYRNREGVVDPEKQATVQLQMISKLQDELIATKTQLLQLRAFTPGNPQIPVLQTRVSGLGQEINEQLGMVAGNRTSLAARAARYQRLQLENQFAERELAAAMTALQEARNEARRKRAYVERIVQPNLPDAAVEPRRLRGVMATFILGLVVWGILTLLFAGVKEHNDR